MDGCLGAVLSDVWDFHTRAVKHSPGQKYTRLRSRHYCKWRKISDFQTLLFGTPCAGFDAVRDGSGARDSSGVKT
jgi:hypothetical protein